MKIKLYRSSTLGIIFEDFKILTDPWLTDGEYYGSWYHYPCFNLEFNLNEINSYDAIYISHIHPDHCSEDTLKHINKNIPIFIHSFHAKFLKRKLLNLGFKVNELQNNKRYPLTKKIGLNIIAADNCNPQLCYNFTGCADLNSNNGSQQIDTICLVDDGKNVILNLNDCPYELVKNLKKKIKLQYEEISVLLTGYSGAGPYPQCFDNLNLEQKCFEAEKKKKYFLNQAFNYIKLFDPKYYMPFAGTYMLGGNLVKLNNLRGVPFLKEAHEFLEKKIYSEKIRSLSMNMYNEDIFDFNEKFLKKGPINNHMPDKLFFEKISKNKMNYETNDVPRTDEIISLIEIAKEKYFEKIENFNLRFKSKLVIEVDNNYSALINSQNKKMEILKNDNLINQDNFVKIRINKTLLKNILKGPKFAHWNNAEVGSHLRFLRNPDIYERSFYFSLSYLHV